MKLTCLKEGTERMVAFIILNYESVADLKRCVASIREKTELEYRIYIVDNASQDDSVIELKKEYSSVDDVRIITSECNRGYSAGNNIGIKQAVADGADKLIIVNPDVILKNDIAMILADKMDKRKNIGVAIPYIIDANGNFGQIFRKQYTFERALTERKPLLYLTRLNDNLSLHIRNVDIKREFEFQGSGSGCCFMISSELISELGYLDEEIFLYYEEYVLGKKLQDRKLKVLYVPQAMIIHNHRNEKKYCTASTNYYRYLSSLYVLGKYEKCSKWKLRILLIENTILLLLRSIYLKEYRGMTAKYFKNANSLLKNIM